MVNTEKFIAKAIDEIKKKSDGKKVVMALSGKDFNRKEQRK